MRRAAPVSLSWPGLTHGCPVKFSVIPAEAGIQSHRLRWQIKMRGTLPTAEIFAATLDPRLRGDDGENETTVCACPRRTQIIAAPSQRPDWRSHVFP